MKVQFDAKRMLYMLFTFILAIPSTALAQNCEAILGYVRDTTESSLTQSSYHSFKRFFCDQTFSSYQQARDAGLKLGIVLEDLPITFEGHDRSSSFSQYQHSLCESVDAQSSAYLAIQTKVVTANANVVNAWVTCITQPGVHFFAESSDTDASLVTFVATYNGLQTVYEANVNGPIQWVPTTALKCDSAQIGKKRSNSNSYYINNQHSTLTCVRPSNNEELAAGVITLKTAADDRVVHLAAYSPPPVIKEVYEESNKTCNLADNQIANDGVLGPGTTHRFGVGCDASGTITRYTVSCTGPCGHAYRDASIAAQDTYYNDHKSISAKYFIDDSQPTRTFQIVVYYQVPKRICIAHCKGISDGIMNSEVPPSIPVP
jgi:hypothetical protein